ncbi:MAG: dephospho-CoA kinase [Gemmatimonadota bacterium]
MFRVGLTGNVASGKSSVARRWAELGAAVIDADVLARRAVEPGTPGLERVRAAFGDEVMRGGGLDREALGRLVFSDPDSRKRLEAIVHPEVKRLRDREEARLKAEGAGLVVHDIPLLFEVGLEGEFDMIVLVDAPREVRAERLVRDRGMPAAEARAVIDAQMPAGAKRGRADMVIENTGTLGELRAEADAVWREIRRRAGGARRVRVDMHIHTRISFDCRSDPEAVVERALEAGLDRICITDHNEIEAALELAGRYPDRIIPGEEVRTAEGVDVTGLYLKEWIPKGTPAREACERIREQGGLVYVPHPFAGGKGGGGAILPAIEDLVDVVEGFNARIHDPRLNERARAWARARDLPLGAGSDAHTLREIGNAWAELPAFDNEPRAFLAALRQGSVHGREASRLVHLASTFAKLLP